MLHMQEKPFMKECPPKGGKENLTVLTAQSLPNRAPTARLALLSSSWLMAAKELKMSGAPLPRARRVTPATFWLSLNIDDMTVSAGQKLRRGNLHLYNYSMYVYIYILLSLYPIRICRNMLSRLSSLNDKPPPPQLFPLPRDNTDHWVTARGYSACIPQSWTKLPRTLVCDYTVQESVLQHARKQPSGLSPRFQHLARV